MVRGELSRLDDERKRLKQELATQRARQADFWYAQSEPIAAERKGGR
jgi:hypothetical protein